MFFLPWPLSPGRSEVGRSGNLDMRRRGRRRRKRRRATGRRLRL